MNRVSVLLWLAVCVLAGGAEPVLERAPGPGGPWAPDPDALLARQSDGTFQAMTPAPEPAGFYRLLDPDTGETLSPLSIGPALAVLFAPGSGEQAGTAQDRAVLKAAVQVAAAGLGAVAVEPGGAYDDATIQAFVDAIRFLDDQSGYFFVYDYMNNVCHAHAVLKDFIGQDKGDYQDSRGMYVIRELSAIAQSEAHAGYLVYYWNNPVSGEEERKLGYIEVIPGTTLYIGSGIYVD